MDFPETVPTDEMPLFIKECQLAGYQVGGNPNWPNLYIGEHLFTGRPISWCISYHKGSDRRGWYVSHASDDIPADVLIDGCPACDWLKTTYEAICNSRRH